MPRKSSKTNTLQTAEPIKPKHLSARASKEWDRLIGELKASRINVTPAHRAALTMAATIAADIADAWATVQRDGSYVRTKFGLVAHPASKRLDALRRDYVKALTTIGLRPPNAKVETDSEVQTLAEILAGA